MDSINQQLLIIRKEFCDAKQLISKLEKENRNIKHDLIMTQNLLLQTRENVFNQKKIKERRLCYYINNEKCNHYADSAISIKENNNNGQKIRFTCKSCFNTLINDSNLSIIDSSWYYQIEDLFDD